ncbi:GAF domain-containing protein [Dolichospermum sp. UHCC 0259]|uniref:GAF domain-containing protein n=1 Tax=Dolichospermum sp. UHCC 0259 TaxID=2590010 RepID=UPI001444E503|nr:GAF domain-containing protein [Dolichospermum sp. UHCC 0259]MTJ47184.1 PAS domain S-box protein [Dolichospermum sp. UHCC 0259]
MFLPNNERQRIKLLNQYQILNTAPETVFDEIAQLAADICNTPIALISLVDEKREWFKSKIGIDISEIPRDLSFGSHILLEREILVIRDTLQHERFASNPLVVSNPYCRFYAGVPLINAQGFALGSLCVMDIMPRTLTITEAKGLKGLAKQVMRFLDLHQHKFLENSQWNSHLLFTHHPSPMWIYDGDTLRFLDVNEAAITHYGYSKSEFLQMRIIDIHPLEDMPMLLAYIAKNRSGLCNFGKWRHTCRNGKVIFVEITSNTIQYNSQNAILIHIQDLSKYQKLELKLQDSEAKFRVISQAIPIPLVISRLSDGIIIYANPEFLHTFKFSPDDLLQKRISDLYHDKSDWDKLLTTFNQNGCLHNHEIQLNKADGTNLWLITYWRYLKYNNEPAVLQLFNDITDRKNSEVKLQEQNDFLQTIFKNIPLMIALIDGNYQVQWVNQNLEETLKYSLQDFQTRNIFAELYPDEEYRQEVIDFVQSAQPVWQDFKTHLQDGSIMDTSWTNVKLPNRNIIGIGKDIRERKQNESILKAQAEREKLMRKVSERIHQSLHLQDILNATVEEVRDLLQVDRVVVYQFYPDMSGKIMAESVLPGWTVTLDKDIHDTCFQEEVISNYNQGRKRAISNIYQASLTDCHIQLLEKFEVKANLVVPILLEVNEENRGSAPWGLLIAHQCSNFREWEDNQLDLLDQLTVQIAIAIQQSNILQQAKSELQQREQAEVKLRSALAEKEILLKEVHHRVKNNLQIVSSLLHLQAQTIKDPQILKAIQDSQNRIESISLIHKNLYTNPNIGKIDIAEYINNLVTGILISYQITPGQISLQTDIDSVILNVDQAIACGLIINELISNALKHAFPDITSGEISINLHKNKNYDITMRIQDNGIGLADNIDWGITTSLGLSLVYDLVTEQLEGSITIERNRGTIFNIQFSQFTSHE